MISNKEKFLKYRPKKFLGQNFLVDDNIAKKIVRSLDIKENDPLLEIGPGHGSLTKHLVKISKNYSVIELDKNIIEKLKQQYENKIKIIHKDFLELDFNTDLKDVLKNDRKIKIIGNVPYNITTEILFKLFKSKDRIDSVVMMIQKEVAQRLTAKPNTKDYGILAIQTQLNSEPSILFNVPPTAFFPKPKVHSSVIRLDFGKEKYNLYNKELFTRIVKESFGKRRKTMRNSLKDLFSDLNINTSLINFDFSRRPENVSIGEFVNFSNEIFELKKASND
ncbi:MAG: 16S rRNA (adenine(1518)-N(6)/adenine(1519)-N(6))-dimethyltransferase RsmA [Bacteroidetes bacterium]|nr:16S rRNA (adenine(1518)-N(6)/adenine(1519)-N(6))-dimethyltransferase RsmA [Bacteroidota bacterium]